MTYVWNAAQARYRDVATGRFVSRSTVLSYLRESMDASSNEMKLLGSQAATGKLSAKDFGILMRREVQDEFIRQYMAGRGGLGSMDQADWGRVGRMLRDQYAYLKGFEADLANLSEAQAAQRANLYAQAAGAAFHTGERVAMREAGRTEELWVLGDAEHCDDCERLSSLGWVPIGELPTVPRAGSTSCLVNCECSLRYR